MISTHNKRVYGDVTTLLPVLCYRILSDWLEVKLGGDERSEVTESAADDLR